MAQIKLGQFLHKETTAPVTADNPLHVEQSGSIALQETVLAREVRNAGLYNALLSVPHGAKGFQAYSTLHGATGTFESGEGLRLVVDQRHPISTITPMFRLATNRYNDNNEDGCIFVYPGLRKTDSDPNLVSLNRQLITDSLVVAGLVNFRLDITGSFESGEGMECQLVVNWIL